jgi:hypothetical protein
MNRLIIGTVTAQLTPDEATITPDDRREIVKTVTYSGGAFVPSVCVIDGGYCAAGQIDSYQNVKFKLSDWPTVLGYATARTLVSVTGIDGITESNCWVKIGQYMPQKKFNSMIANIEIGRA